VYKIGDLSKRTGVSRETIRYYEHIGLLPKPTRAYNNYRLYTQTDVERLRFIQRARMLEFSLDDIAEILAFRDRNEPPCNFVLDLMQTQIQTVENHIKDLIKLHNELVELYNAGQSLPQDVKMETCVCHLIKQHSD
jgi:DNA-binding transcriptional MerR regulator